MAANTGQGRSFTVFLVGLTVACVGIAYFSSTFGKPLFVVGLVIFVASLFGFLKLKPLEGKPALGPTPTMMKLVGAFLAAFGWVITLFGMHIVDGTSGRLVLGPRRKHTATVPNAQPPKRPPWPPNPRPPRAATPDRRT